ARWSVSSRLSPLWFLPLIKAAGQWAWPPRSARLSRSYRGSSCTPSSNFWRSSIRTRVLHRKTCGRVLDISAAASWMWFRFGRPEGRVMAVRALRIASRLAAALGFLSITLTGEMTPTWVFLIWGAWGSSFISDRYPSFQARLRRFETAAVIGMVGLLFVDF